MTTERNFELKVGLFVAIGIVIFFMMVFSIGDIQLVKKGYRVEASFSFIDGVVTSAPVRYAGVAAGYIEDIKLYFDKGENKTKVMVILWINDVNRKIEKDSTVTINTLGLLGEKYIEIYPGKAESGVVEPNGTLKAKDPITMKNVTDTINSLAENANGIMVNLRQGKGTIGKLLTDETIYNDMEAFVADIKAHPWKLLCKPRGE